MDTIRVVVFEDNLHLLEGLFMLINETPGFNCIGTFPDCNEIINDLQKNIPDVVLMDIEMPGIDGIEGVKIIKKHFPDVQVLMQTVFTDNDKIFKAICAGASGYILKSTSPQGYLDAITDVFNGGSPLTGNIARRVLELFQNNIKLPEGNQYQLTPKEKEILTLLVQGKSNKMIADDLSSSFETVRTHMKNIYRKLHVNSNTEAVSKAINEKIV